jgi:7-cyano-7-deazaguanine synthase
MRTAVLLSGGIDSLVCAERARVEGRLAGCVFVDYGHPAQIAEGWRAFAYAGERGVPLLAPHLRDLDLGTMPEAVGPCIVPARNAILLSVAANAAGRLGAESITIGANAADRDAYPDCRGPFLDAMSAALGLPIEAPLLTWDKPRIIAEARALGLSSADAWSCYGTGPIPCGVCASCVEASIAWSSPMETT